jgi:ParB family transcriptional regulator, chromosome partitioning protein
MSEGSLRMAEETGRSRLGRGLAALIGDVGDETAAMERARGQRRVPVEFLRPNPRNPRRQFVEVELADLTDSIREKGIIQPILVRTIAGMADAYEIIAGERRWRAAQRAGLHNVPILIVEANDRDALEIAIIENVQRADLNAVEEAQGYERLQTEFKYTQDDLARIIGKSRPHVANMLRLLKLPAPVLDYVQAGAMSAGHARALIGTSSPHTLARRIVEEGLSVRDVEKLVQREHQDSPSKPKARAKSAKDPDTVALEEALEAVLGMTVLIDHKGEGGELRVRYASLEQLDALCKRLRD